MSAPNKRRLQLMAGFALVLLLSTFISVQAQNPEQQQTAANTVQSQINQADQMLGPLNLTPDQIEKIKLINAELMDERQAANFRLRLAKRALAQAVQSPTPDETLIAQRSEEVADAQANTIRLRSLTQVRILRVLTPEQRIKLRTLQNQATIRNERRGGQRLPRVLGRPQHGLQRNSNANPPRRAVRQQQQRP